MSSNVPPNPHLIRDMPLQKQHQDQPPQLFNPAENYQSYKNLMAQVDQSTFDEDQDMRLKYLEKEYKLKKINEELERRSSEIFSKIEKLRLESPRLKQKSFDELGQGDSKPSSPIPPREDRSPDYAPSKSSFVDYDFKPRSQRPEAKESFRNIIAESYAIAQRASSALSNPDAPKYSFDLDDFNLEPSFTKKRPATAALTSSLPSSSISSFSKSQTDLVGPRRTESARALDSLEEKHQARLQKATESVLKCVQSKLVNYESRMTDMHLQYRQKIQENTMLESKVKALEDDRKKLLKTVQTLQNTTDKFSKCAENTKMNLNLKSQAFGSLKKEMENMKKDLKQKNGLIQSLQTRLDRCTEENRRLKSQHQSTHTNMRQQLNDDRITMDELKSRIAQLEQQKASFQATVEKQANLVRTLRNQKVRLIRALKDNKIKLDESTESSESFDCADVNEIK